MKDLETRNLLALRAAAAFRAAFALMDEALGYDASTELAQSGLEEIIAELEKVEFVGVVESV
jgi:hypothetical protein